jgi:hypothetical protein
MAQSFPYYLIISTGIGGFEIVEIDNPTLRPHEQYNIVAKHKTLRSAEKALEAAKSIEQELRLVWQALFEIARKADNEAKRYQETMMNVVYSTAKVQH